MADSVPAPPGSDADKLQKAKSAENEIFNDAKKAGIPAYKADSELGQAEKAAQPKEVIPTDSG